MSKIANNICVYCGSPDPKEKDHIPPKGLFKKPRPSRLITVPCCSICHAGTSKDDEYIRDMLTFRNDLFNNPIIQSLLPKVLRGLDRPEKRKSLIALQKNIQLADLKTRGGIIVGTAPILTLEKRRFEKVINRIVKGLFYYEAGKPFPVDSTINSYLAEAIDIMRYNNSQAIIDSLANAPERIIEPDTFKFRRFHNIDQEYEVWLLTFYNSFESISFILHNIDQKNYKESNHEIR